MVTNGILVDGGMFYNKKKDVGCSLYLLISAP